MFSLISGFVNWYFAMPTFKLLIIGEEKAGKSTYLEHLKHIYTGRGCPLEYVLPTSGLNLTKFKVSAESFLTEFYLKYNDSELLFWDLSGKESFRKLWEQYYDDIEGLIYVIDATSEKVEEAVTTLNKVITNRAIQNSNIPILILINKIDLIGLDLNKLQQVYNYLDYNKLQRKHFLIKDASALKGTGLEDSIRWLFNAMIDYARDNSETPTLQISAESTFV